MRIVSNEKKTFVGGIITGIVGIIFAVLFPAVTYGCSIPGVVLSVKRAHKNKTTAAFVLNVTALALSMINSVTAVCITARGFFKRHPNQF